MSKSSEPLCAKRHEAEGFGLIELIVVVGILTVLVAVAVPVYGAIQENARHTALEQAAANGAKAVASNLAQGKPANESAFLLVQMDNIDNSAGLNQSKDNFAYWFTQTNNGLGWFGNTKPIPIQIEDPESTNEVYVYAANLHGEIAGAGPAGAPWNNWD